MKSEIETELDGKEGQEQSAGEVPDFEEEPGR